MSVSKWITCKCLS